MKYLSRVFYEILPNHCRVCRQSSGDALLCAPCIASLPWNITACFQCALPMQKSEVICGGCLANPPAFSRSISAFRYEPPVSDFIMQLKFQKNLLYARVLSQLLQDFIEDQYQEQALPECIIPVPLHPQRLRERGFNQAIEIAKPLAKHFKIPLLYDVCRRKKNTKPQSQLSAAARKRNIAGAFTLQKSIAAQHVAIIDDVVTTGQTVRTLSRLLKRHGITKIDLWSCARAV